MECMLVFFAVLVTLLAVMLVATRGARNSTRLRSAYRQLAVRRSGSYRSTGWFRHPQVRLLYGSAVVYVEPLPAAAGRQTTTTGFRIDWPDPKLRCEIFGPPNLYRRLMPNLPTLSIGPAEFASRFRTYGDDPAEIASLLNGAVIWQIQKLRHFLGSGNVRITFGDGLMTVEKLPLIRRGDELLTFVDLAIELYDQAMLTRSAGIEFVADDSAAQVLESVMCRVCGEAIEVELVFCQRCKTPHHRDCWHFNGTCSVFGCGETQFAVPRLASAVKAPNQPTKSDAPPKDGPRSIPTDEQDVPN